jgi:glycosyltransferase involved in cell wall biosynthesis
MKHIVIDARIVGSSTGVYAENLLNHLQTVDTANRYTVLLRKAGVWQPRANNFTVKIAAHKDYSLSEQLGLAWLLYRLKPDLVHFCMPQQPLLYIGARVTTVHDLTLVKFANIDMNPLIYKLRQLIFTGLLRNVIWRSKVILTPTDFVRNDVLAFSSQRHADKVATTLEAGEPLADAPEVMTKFDGTPFILSINNAFPYKNLLRIAEAFAQLKTTYPKLQLLYAGKKNYFYEQLEQQIAELGIPDVHFLGYISEGEKRWALQHAQAYVVASYSEGFHITGLEAMFERCPVISSSASCLPEVYADAARYFNPDRADELADAVREIIDDTATRTSLIKKGLHRVTQFSWLKMARQTHAAYEAALERST